MRGCRRELGCRVAGRGQPDVVGGSAEPGGDDGDGQAGADERVQVFGPDAVGVWPGRARTSRNSLRTSLPSAMHSDTTDSAGTSAPAVSHLKTTSRNGPYRRKTAQARRHAEPADGRQPLG